MAGGERPATRVGTSTKRPSGCHPVEVKRGLSATIAAGCCVVLAACAAGAPSQSQGTVHKQQAVANIWGLNAPRTAGGTTLFARRADPVYPLTGVPAPNAAAASNPSLAVKIDNVSGAFPQAGLNQADIVFDILVEGGLTRLMAVYQSHRSDVIGPIRSARPVDAYLLRLFNGGYFAFSGASRPEMRPVRNRSHAVLLYNDATSAPFYRRSDHVAPDDLFSSSAALSGAFRRLKPNAAGPPQVFDYARAVPQGKATSSVTVPFPAATAAWQWNGHEYLRTQDGQPDVLIGGDRVSAANVVVMSVHIVGTGIFETNGAEDPLPVTVGAGACWVLRDGVRVQGRWERKDAAHRLHLFNGHHQPIKLTPGRTWVELMPSTGTPTFHH
jgi:Protein of unknown function (DUF3048) N-terminal domain/Protein of unknown function (DUF3048) C-terminal domain